jgi:acetyl-CoA C-acetyltransferase
MINHRKLGDEAVLVSGSRIPVGKFGLAFKDLSASKLGAAVIQEAVKRAGIRLAHLSLK